MKRSMVSAKRVLLLALLTLQAACGGDSGEGTDSSGGTGDLLSAVQQRGKLRVALEAIYKPGAFLDDHGKIIGFNPDVAEEVAKRLGLHGVEYVEPAFEVIAAGNWQGRWDVAVNALTITQEREKALLFTQPYIYADSYVAVHANNATIRSSTTDLDGKRIGTCAGCTQQRYLEQDLAIPNMQIEFHIHNADVRPYQGGSGAAIEDLSLGDGVRLDAVLDEIDGICQQRARGRPIKVVPDRRVMFTEASGFAFDARSRQDAAKLRDKVNLILSEMRRDGTLAAISRKWYHGWDRTQPGGMPPNCGDQQPVAYATRGHTNR